MQLQGKERGVVYLGEQPYKPWQQLICDNWDGGSLYLPLL